jgi:outer membrane protein OmpA-like peptidoglycan-associated protein
MKFKGFYLLALVFLCSVQLATAQSSRKLERAKSYMKDLNYQSAIEIYNSVLRSGDNSEAKIGLAECYRKVSDSENAEFLYGQVVRLPEAQPIHFLYYGEMLQRNGKCDLAREWYGKFAKAVPEDVRGQYLDKACDYEQELKTKGDGIYTVQRALFNSNLDDFGTAYYKDGIVFASERDKGAAVKRNHAWTGNPFLDLYFVPVKGSGASVTYGKPEKFNSDINSKYHDAIVSFPSDQNQIFFTRNNYTGTKRGADDQGIMRLKIYQSKKKNSGWGSEESLPFNSDEYSCAHPALNGAGTKLYFASDMPGGFGGMDIYVSELENGRWGPPMNMGPSINTEGNELFPNVAKNGRLYYSSDGQLGLGGLDIYFVDPKDGNQFTVPENIGAPINSKDDDFGITFSEDGASGFFSSDRQGGAGHDDIYSFVKTAAPLQIYVFDAVTKEPIEGAEVKADSCQKKLLKTDKNGKATIEVKFNSCCNFTASKETFEKNAKQGCVKDANSTETNIVEIPLQKVLKFGIEGIVFDDVTGLPLDGAKVTLMGNCPDSNQVFTTDASGRFNFKISRDCCYKLRGERDKYFSVNTPDTLCSKLLKESKILQATLKLQPTQAAPRPEKPLSDVPSETKPNTNDTYSNTTPTPGDVTTPTTGKRGKNGKKGSKANPTDGATTDVTTDKPSKTKKPKTIYYDPTAGVYIDPKTNQPAEGKHGGIAYKGGQLVTESGEPNTKFQPSNTTYADGSQGYLLHIYYDFDQSYLRKESMPELEKLLKLLQENPTYIVELGSHTDSRGSNNYNNRLSQRRAESVVRWLIEKGLERDRLVPRGYGETLNTNQCKNNIPCSEQEHQMNRRTEFRVLGCKGCVDDQKTKLSRPNENAKVDKCHGCPF